MRALRYSLVAGVVLALLGGMGGAALAQDDEETSFTATYVTGKQTGGREAVTGTFSEGDGMERYYGAVYEDTIEWSDPRLSSVLQISENLDMRYREDGGDAWIWFGSIRMEDAEGAWSGQEYGIGEWQGDGPLVRPRMMILEGEGAYEGLTAMLQRRWEPDDPNYHAAVEGYIIEGELPSMPDPVEPSTE